MASSRFRQKSRNRTPARSAGCREANPGYCSTFHLVASPSECMISADSGCPGIGELLEFPHRVPHRSVHGNQASGLAARNRSQRRYCPLRHSSRPLFVKDLCDRNCGSPRLAEGGMDLDQELFWSIMGDKDGRCEPPRPLLQRPTARALGRRQRYIVLRPDSARRSTRRRRPIRPWIGIEIALIRYGLRFALSLISRLQHASKDRRSVSGRGVNLK